jgi:dTDP-4-amino-4,6-dideoxygalactose transaminase
VTNSIALKKRAVYLATQAREEMPHYQHSEIGYNYRMSNICAAIGIGQMEVLDEHILLRRKMHEFYLDVFKDIEGVTVFTVANENSFSNYWLSTVLINPTKTLGITREDLRLVLEGANIESRPLCIYNQFFLTILITVTLLLRRFLPMDFVYHPVPISRKQIEVELKRLF